MIDPRAGQLPLPESLVDLAALERAYYDERPDAADPGQRVSFGTSGHRGSSLRRSFNEAHIAAITQAICEWRKQNRIDGPLFVGMDTHALSVPAHTTALEVLTAHGVHVRIAPGGAYTPTPAVSRAIIRHNRGAGPRADGIVITPSHNPPEDGGFKYDPPHGGPAESAITTWIERRANELLPDSPAQVRRVASPSPAGRAETFDFMTAYVDDLGAAIDVAAIARERPRLGVDPLGGASVEYWGRISERYGFDLTVVNRLVDKTFRFVPLDHDGRIRTDCSSPYSMASLLAQKDRFDLALGNDGDADRHGVVTPSDGLLSPNHYLSAAVDYLSRHRPDWPASAGIGMTAVTSDMLRRVIDRVGRQVLEVPVGFKWFVEGLGASTLAFGGEESAGASFLARDGSTWTTDKDGILLALLAAEILAVTGRHPGQHYAAIEQTLGRSYYTRLDAPASRELRDRLRKLTPDDWKATRLGGDSVLARRTKAGNGADLGGLRVESATAWFALRPSGTEEIYKIYAESFRSETHLGQVIAEVTHEVGGLLKG